MIRLALGFAAGFVAAFVVMGRARQAALTADPHAEDWRTVQVRPNGYEWWGPPTTAAPTNFVRTWTEETH